ncbi:PPR26 phosphatase, partial [Nothoprocta ornata]|nr:PPR26 phosphatase [Nothoprocta ornata]
MFLLNASPLVALQGKWGSFGASRSYRYPVCIPEAEGDVTRTSVSAKVQMIINNLQSPESPLGMNNEYDCFAQKKQKGEKGSSNRVASSAALLRKHRSYNRQSCPADSDGSEVDENVDFGPLLLDSDSDDSVDRDIEEAIQEYLKAKSKSDQSLQGDTECSENTRRDKRFKREFSESKMANNLLPVKFKAEVLSEDYLSEHLGIGKRRQPASPQSISSDDSFEQSIQAEIVQFLNEKKQQEISKCVIGEDKKDSPVRSALKCNKETTNKANCGAVKQGCEALLLRHHPKLRRTSTQSKCLKSKVQEEPTDFSQVSQAYLEMATGSRPWLVEQNEESGANFGGTRGELTTEGRHTSDSSSDDGIEEAIQLYQMEKVRQEAGPSTDCIPLQREQFDAKGVADFSASLTISSTRSASPQVHKSPTNSKRKETSSKAAELESTSHEFNKLFKPLKKTGHFAPAENKISACELTLQASCRADTSTELMCAEAILDISKTIMPSQMGSDDKSLSADAFFSPQLLSPSHCDSDSSLVDSDDSIEQEIRAFLALKAQSGSPVTKPPSPSHAAQMPLLSDDSNLAGTLEPPLPKTLKLSLSRKRRLKREGRRTKQGVAKTPEQFEKGFFQQDCCPKFSVLQEGCAPSSPKELCDAHRGISSKETGQQQPVSSELSGSLGKCVALDSANPFMQVQSSTRKLITNTIPTQERDGTAEESSSLDSDEDLDSAIKDLLRSKRKLKKKPKDQKAQGKKRVRFSETDTQLLDEFSSLQQNKWKCKNPVLLKSCLAKSGKAMKENATRNPSDNISVKLLNERPETMKNLEFNLQLKKGCKRKPVSSQNNVQTAKNKKSTSTAASATDDSSSLDSDDSIEQEIQKFLAEKAKDSSGNSEMQRDDAALDFLGVTKQSANKGKAKQQPAENEIDLLVAPSKKTKVSPETDEPMSSPGMEGKSAMLLGSERNASCAEDVHLHTTGQSKAKQGVLGAKGSAAGESPAKGNAASKKEISSREPVPKKDPPKPSKNDGRKVQKLFKAKPRSKRKNTFHLKISSKFIAGLKYARDRQKSLLLNKRQKAEGLLAQASAVGAEGASTDTDTLKQGKEALLPKGDCDGEKKTGLKESVFSHKLSAEASSPHIADTCKTLETAPLYIKEEAEVCKKENTLGDQADSGLSLQEHSVAAGKAEENTQRSTEEGDAHKDRRGDSHLAPQLPEPSLAAVKADQVSGEASQQSMNVLQGLNVTAVTLDKARGGKGRDRNMHMCVEQEDTALPQDSARQEETRVSSSSSEGEISVLQGRETDCRVARGQEVVDRNCAKVTDIPADSLLTRKVPN